MVFGLKTEKLMSRSRLKYVPLISLTAIILLILKGRKAKLKNIKNMIVLVIIKQTFIEHWKYVKH